MDETRVITLMAFDTVGEAEVIHGLLGSAGIRSIVANDLLAGMFPTAGNLLKVRILINEEDEKKAKKILAAKFDEQEFAEGTTPRRGRRKKEDS